MAFFPPKPSSYPGKSFFYVFVHTYNLLQLIMLHPLNFSRVLHENDIAYPLLRPPPCNDASHTPRGYKWWFRTGRLTHTFRILPAGTASCPMPPPVPAGPGRSSSGWTSVEGRVGCPSLRHCAHRERTRPLAAVPSVCQLPVPAAGHPTAQALPWRYIRPGTLCSSARRP